VLEFEALAIGVFGKRQLWTTIAELPADHPAASAVDTSQLIIRADRQAQRLQQMSERAGKVAFTESDTHARNSTAKVPTT
jgi:hypothetical protein